MRMPTFLLAAVSWTGHMESLSHMTARHDYNWAKVAPQVALSVSSIMAGIWRVGGH